MTTTRLGRMLYLYRTINQKTIRAMAAQVGTSPATMLRLEQGKPCDLETWIKLQTWLVEPVQTSEPAAAAEAAGK